ncbi:MAG: hypothetical protein H7259_01180 [Cytophagales bacterium]|nr:hypothetical protein [Cytophaga sp.]
MTQPGTDLIPAILNEDWLIYLGFEKCVWMERHEVMDLSYILPLGNSEQLRLRKTELHYELVEPFIRLLLRRIKYVRALQNFYEGHTGIRLK